MLLDFVIVAVVGVFAAALWWPRLRASSTWRAMTTPLASIIGSGFLVLGPILNNEYGAYAPAVMVALCLGSYLLGAAIRYNMRAIEAGVTPWPDAVETVSSWALCFAYVVSVAYYLNLFGAFAVSLSPYDDALFARIVTTAIYLVIAAVGWTRGFRSLEAMEYLSVTIKLAIIAGLLVGLGTFFFERSGQGALVFPVAQISGWAAVTLGFGLIVTVQGFETSRYLGASYDTDTRVRSMKWAQWLSAAIYILYIVLVSYVFRRDELQFSETAIVHMMGVITPLLPLLLVAAALAAQFSAAVADTSGSGGLMAELSGQRIRPRLGYLILTLTGLVLTWVADVFQIISYASRAFAVYYALQSGIAALVAWRRGQKARAAGFMALAVLGFAIAVFGQAVEV
ncbi:hypothetical protein FIU94_00470 [Sulfitobacter sp. THAF37]|uniref:hypothetical protein n=1 Tax=Sulfitobacter sp. THAF37 TaxID=2587855 RepID=UPI0012696FB6|nr:hypothetical protein [Sulfitobacter sp. THAF37]QFT57281.1 hypothetical protein FIU94_00470 [Sulfitobacter sp. THAF37]